MKKQLIDIWNVEDRRTGCNRAVCLSLKEANDAYEYLTEIVGWPKDALCISEAHAYKNGWFRDLIEDERTRQRAEAHDDADDYLISDDLLDEANDHYNHFV